MSKRQFFEAKYAKMEKRFVQRADKLKFAHFIISQWLHYLMMGCGVRRIEINNFT